MLLVLLLGTTDAQQKGDKKQPKPVARNAKRGDFQLFPLGPIGGTAEVLADQNHAVIKFLQPDRPGSKAGLKVGDTLVSAAGKGFPKYTRNVNEGGHGPQAALGMAIERAETKGPLELLILRGEQMVTVRVRLPATQAFSATFPQDCKKSRRFFHGICQALVRSQQNAGNWRAKTGQTASRFITAYCALALLGRGEPQYLPNIRKAARYLQGKDGKAFIPDGFGKGPKLDNWPISATAIFLSEYVLATGDKSVRPTIQRCVDCLAKRVSIEGKMGHGVGVGYRGKGFNVINTQSHLAWALAQQAGCRINKPAWTRSLALIRKSTGKNGGVRYWTSQTGYGDASARTGSMALALAISGQLPKSAQAMAAYLTKHHKRMREAHAMGSIGMIFGTAALRQLNPAGYRTHMDYWRWYLNLSRQPDGSAAYVGSKRNNGGDHYLGQQHVGNAIAGLMLSTAARKLFICGGRKKNWLAP